jgi:starvation-inducible DNA-binding protein
MITQTAPRTNAATLVDELSRFLASSYTLYLKTQNYHWNVKGPNFPSLHLLFETQYQDLAAAIDAVAERIRSLGAPAPGSYAYFAKNSAIAETAGVPNAEDMVAELVRDNQTVVNQAKEIIPAAEDAGDVASVDLLTQRIAAHEKTVWMLRTVLE